MNEPNVTKNSEVVGEVIQTDAVENATIEPIVESNTDLAKLSSTSIDHFDEQIQKEILRVANEIDVCQPEKIMAYGQNPIKRSFELAGKILKEEQGSSADQEVVKMAAELAKQAKDSYNLVIEEPNFFQKLILKITSAAKDDSKEVKVKAVTCYKILEQYIAACDEWIKKLEDTYRKMMLSAENYTKDCYELEQYIVAGYLAQDRVSGEIEVAKKDWEETGIITNKDKYDMLKEGLEIFQVVLLNLEKSRAAYGITLGQLGLEIKTNKTVQIAVRTQKQNSSTLAAQQLLNAVYGAINKGALDAQKSITKLNDDLMQKVSEGAVVVGEEAERILLNGVYTAEAGLQAAQTVIDGYNSIKAIREERIVDISENLKKLKPIVDELTPYVENLQKNTKKEAITENTSATSNSSTGLTF